MLERLAAALGFGDSLARVRALPRSAPELAADPALLIEQARSAAHEDGARSVIIGGAALAGVVARIADRVEVPLIDSVACSARAVAKLCSRS
jgi:Asp/Glu/hydantoin racemase